LQYWQYCYERYIQLRKEKNNLDERIELLKALGVTKDAWLQNRLLSYVMTLPTVEITPTLEAIASTPTGGAMACRFLQAKWFDLQKRFGRGSINFAKVIASITKYGANKFDYDEVSINFGSQPIFFFFLIF
jgi:ERAP1-like C-terminal domain